MPGQRNAQTRKDKYSSLTSSVLSLSAPLTGILASNIDNRLLGIIGGVMSGLSVIGASFAANIPVLVLFLSIVNGMYSCKMCALIA